MDISVVLLPINTGFVVAGVFKIGRLVQKLDDLKESSGKLEHRIERIEEHEHREE
jgi:hypothetical protein